MSEIKLTQDLLPISPHAEKVMKAQEEKTNAAAAKELAAGQSGAQGSTTVNTKAPDFNARAQLDKRDPKMLVAARSFENQFIRQMIAEMRKTVPKDDLTGESMTEDIFREQLDGEYADNWVKEGGTGLADMIYDQLYEKYGNAPKLPQKDPGEFLKLPQRAATASEGRAVLGGASAPALAAQPQPMSPAERPKDILATADKNLFLAKKESGGYMLKSREPLPESVGLRSPLSGVVLQAAALEDGREMVVVKHDQGLISQFVHSGHNRVRTQMRVDAGQVIAELPASQNGEGARVFFALKK